MGIFKKIAYVTLVIACVLMVLAYLSSRMEIMSASFTDYADAQSSMQAGWLPSWLPESAYEIDESHDIDSNVTWVKFRYSTSERFFEVPCRLIDKDEVSLPKENYIKRFPDFVVEMYADIKVAESLHFYSCEDGMRSRYLALKEAEGIAYSWSLGE